MRAGRIALIVVGVLVALMGFGMFVGGGALVWAHATQRDSAGFYTTPVERLSTPTYALTSGVTLGSHPERDDFVWWSRGLGSVRVRATSERSETPLFIGIARRADVDRWLAGAEHERVTELRFGPFRTDTEFYAGAAPAAPTSQTFWVASAVGTGRQSLEWDVESGRWAVVLMNADGSRGVAASTSVGVKTGLVLPIGLGVGGFGLVLILGGIVLMVVGARGAGSEGAATVDLRPGAAVGESAAAGPVAAGPLQAYPARLDGHLEPVSRWLWLVKWLLVIPHVFVLAFLWIAFCVLTVVAGFAILFKGRYPRRIFDFNVGVIRWTWRVSFYAVSAFGTDKYPPFTLAADPAYPAAFDIDYPEQLSRGLVLVKWWLLAIPHYLIVGILAGGWAFASEDGRALGMGGGLISLLAVVAIVIAAFTGRYPDSLFDLVMGLNRWVYRVLAYAGLMTDEYPPFRLDSGGIDPGSMPSGPPEAPTGPTTPAAPEADLADTRA